LQQRAALELALILPRKIERKLREESERTGASVEEIALEALVKGMNERVDPAERAELYARISEKYLRDAEELLTKGGFVQASRFRLTASSSATSRGWARRREIPSSGGFPPWPARCTRTPTRTG